ncbi:hydrogenase [Candidatus Methylomirabilis sp.]|uniref:hydrogenase n=1 Tax=Candidatus Methylomirabilis sp. TaxID=2032687 RepID=UPI002A5C71FE|nr:hydrogenase [Candidatus Methylomirabilis sp.]
MFTILFPRLVTLLSFAMLGTAFLLIVRRDLAGQVRIFAMQSVVLAILAAAVAAFTKSVELTSVALVLVLLKVFIIPRVLNRAVMKIGLQRAALPYLGTPATLVVCGGLVVIAFYVMAPVAASNPLPTAEAIPIAFAGVLIGFFVMVNRRRALTQILGFLMLENSIFLLALLATYGVPFIVEMGVFLDVLVAVLIMEVFIYRIKENFDSIEVDRLGRLKG